MVLAFLCAKAVVAMMAGEDDERLDDWFPRAFRIQPDRFDHKFRGRLHAPASTDVDIETQK